MENGTGVSPERWYKVPEERTGRHALWIIFIATPITLPRSNSHSTLLISHNMSAKVKTVLITGCSAGGIGGALAEAFHESGYHVFATARTPSKIAKSLATAPKVTVLKLDVLSSDSIREAVENVKSQTGGKLDVLVNNSGGGLILPALDTSIEEGKKLFDLNFWAPIAVTQAFAPLLIDAKGCLVNNSSITGKIPMLYNSTS